ncbi:MAG TPA: MqnA/MqnD/SBP family protein [Terrimicrobiaceae bacterium]|jgi:1,4-dihydroxy-6-naphthoate synthase|nr:MqnA/MqnD/SBP family protein [Terrimicrobiaceae bacterium]
MPNWKSTTLTLGHSPDPDDAFMFYAMAENKIDLRGYRFTHILQDIQTLNERATRGELHITAVSIHALAYVLDKYALLPSGASMGDGYGPMFISANAEELSEADDSVKKRWLLERTIAIPGRMTSAFLAAQLFLGRNFRHIMVPFDEIFAAVRSGSADAGLIIHEGQLTYAQEGFAGVLDLGEWWKRTRNLPLPLGGNVIRKDIPHAIRREISGILRESIEYGLEHRAPAVAHSMAHARGLDVPLADRFIGMYVNELTLDYGERGRAAVSMFLGEAAASGLIPSTTDLEFVS